MRLIERGKTADAIAMIDELPFSNNSRLVKAGLLIQINRCAEALDVYETLFHVCPEYPRVYMDFGHALKITGNISRAIEMYSLAIDKAGEGAEAYWNLSNIKTYKFSSAEIERMEAFDAICADDAAFIAFALGKAYEDLRDYDTSFAAYERGNLVRQSQDEFSIVKGMFDMQRQMRTFTTEYFKTRKGHDTTAPIFVL